MPHRPMPTKTEVLNAFNRHLYAAVQRKQAAEEDIRFWQAQIKKIEDQIEPKPETHTPYTKVEGFWDDTRRN